MSIIVTQLPTLSGYQVIELIHDSPRTLVYRGQNEKNGQKVVIKLMRSEYPSFGELVRFRNQYAMVQNLEIDGIIKSYGLERYENRYALVMEDIEGLSLADYKGKLSLSLSQFFNIAIQLADTLYQLHQHQIIHKDIKPANILIHPQSQQVKLIDFSISSLLPKETQTLQTPNVLEGTLAYLSPEQTGRMNRGIDYRSDFYSLGITFYELLVGNVPFSYEDSLELIHAHITQSPEPVSRWIGLEGKFCPEPLSDIVLKLMAKNAEDRYQSALGLKYDLEKCRAQYVKTGTIAAFELGERDICDRFLIPEKLYGRETEVQTLLEAFDRVAKGNSEMMLVAGFSGIGKTVVVNEVHKPITRQKGYFIQGKFDQFNRNIPFSAFVQAFRSLMGQLLGESDADLAQWQAKILEAVGESGQVLIEVIPELERIIGQQPEVPELSGSAAQNRFNLLFGKFIAVFTTKEHPLTIFLDDLQWADSASLNLLQLLMNESESGYLLILGAYRDNEVFPAHPLMLTLDEMRKNRASIETLVLKPLDLEHITHLIADTLLCSLPMAVPLSKLVYQKTQGNPFFTTQFLRGLHEEECLVFDLKAGYWQCNLTKVRELALTDDVVEFMVRRLQKLSSATQDALKIAACIGNQFDSETLAIVCEEKQQDVVLALWQALQEGLIIPENETYKFFQGGDREIETIDGLTVYYRFLHDRVQQAAYALIPDGSQKEIHLKIGQLLLEKTPENKKAEKLFDIVNQLNIGIDLITDETERERLAFLNLEAGTKAKLAIAYTAALKYFDIGIELLPKDCWQKCYSLALKLHENAAEAAYLTGNLKRMEELVEIVTVEAQSCLDRVKTLQVKMQCCAGQNQPLVTIEIARNLLEEFGIVLPKSPTMEDVKEELKNIKDFAAKFTLEEIAELPALTEPEKLAAASTLMLVGAAAIIAAPNLFFFVIFAQVKLSLEYGNSPYSAYGFGAYGVIFNMLQQNITSAYEFGQLALKLVRKSNSNIVNSKVFQILGAYATHGKRHVKETLEFLTLAYTSGLESGDFEFAGYSVFAKCQNLYFLGRELSELEREISKLNLALSSIGQKTPLYWNRSFERAVIKLLGRESNPHLLGGDSFNSHEFVSFQEGANDKFALHYFYFNQAILMYLFGYKNQSLENSKLAEKYLDGPVGFLTETVFSFYDSLIRLGCIEPLDNLVNSDLLIKVSENQKKLKIWADYGPMNFKHKYDLVCAEERRVSGDLLIAIELYDRAIEGAKENGYIQEEALASELAAKFYLDWGKEKFAALYMQEAYYCYAQWGAKAKTNDLEQRYPELLKPIFQRDRRDLSAEATIAKISSNSHSQTATIANISSILDFSSLLKASQALSEEIELESLLSTLMKIILENAGATKGALLLTAETGLVVEAIATRTQSEPELTFDTIHQSIPLEEYPDLPVGLINTVRRTTETALLDAKTAQTQFATDNYLLNVSPKSLLCMPLLERGNLIGILYLENRLTADAFTRDRIDVLDSLCAQAAISLNNARLYQQAQQALQNLKNAQLQLVQNEKMATLGNLVAGVAHEINNPVGFIGGNISAAQEYLQDLLQAIALYAENTTLPQSIVEEIEDLDLEFIAEDFAKLITSMETGCDRIRNISTSLRTFSRADTDKKTVLNLHEGIDSTLLILKYRLKANEQRPAIEIIKNYGKIPEVKCYAGQINQVFMNLFANGIDALEEGNQGKTYEEIEQAPNRITISTELSQNQQHLLVKITDNGMGMSEAVKAKIFEQGFTTKEVGKGTGLGMAIAQQIITEKHGGKIICESNLGRGTTFILDLPVDAPE
ncbi:MAG: AAA family ATPase [Jaaginema sp. PMC 1079.18]|nr:AAA family ATPase [Jaaginema sp. PMC 1080.18]MEC4850395.1 AAA family ATPase [Jaaginema sp. PMC 1079.18]MEC4865136.1 AAA family ATPase [Jaaginema sp. PMC 1078.18]